MDTGKEVFEIALSDIMPNRFQPREIFDENALNELAESIKAHGVIQPIIVRKIGDKFEIIAGERRFRASQMAGLTTIPAIIRDFTDDQMMEIAILENLQRENLSAIEEAEAYKSLMHTLSLNQEQVAKRVGKSRSHITNMIGLLSLPQDVKELINQGKISMGHARILSKLEDIDKIEYLKDKIITDNISVRELESLANTNEFVRKNKQKRQEQSPEYKDLEKSLSEYLGTRVKLKNKKVEISFSNDNDLNRILEIINYDK